MQLRAAWFDGVSEGFPIDVRIVVRLRHAGTIETLDSCYAKDCHFWQRS